MSPAGKKRTRQFVIKVKNTGFWQKFNKKGRVRTSNKSTPASSNARELRGHEHPKEPERNKK